MYDVWIWSNVSESFYPVEEFHGAEVPPGRSLLLHAQIRFRDLRHSNQWKVIKRHRS